MALWGPPGPVEVLGGSGRSSPSPTRTFGSCSAGCGARCCASGAAASTPGSQGPAPLASWGGPRSPGTAWRGVGRNQGRCSRRDSQVPWTAAGQRRRAAGLRPGGCVASEWSLPSLSRVPGCGTRVRPHPSGADIGGAHAPSLLLPPGHCPCCAVTCNASPSHSTSLNLPQL